ncbi:hypothetical protein XELAEV_18027980mg [Xenopus laevis]|uniref:Uncharacterized protein n=1 Tax=Xenopus laevis TaxID=8355 RepID=A0A974HK34_XENLA|nr:hypothetical protein XELAEV_18027980mg [Xenopus laevis]
MTNPRDVYSMLESLPPVCIKCKCLSINTSFLHLCCCFCNDYERLGCKTSTINFHWREFIHVSHCREVIIWSIQTIIRLTSKML